MASDGAKGGMLQPIIIGIVLALVAGGSSPWWWNELFPPGGGSAQPPVGPYMGSLEGGTNRTGGDLSTVGIQSNSAAECSDLCLSDQNCRAMTFVKHDNANGGICWLKGSIPSPSSDQAMVSAIKHYPTQ